MGPDRRRVARPYGELIELAERERELIARRDYIGLSEVVEARRALMTELPGVAPDDSHEAIAHLIEVHRGNDAALDQLGRTVGIELSRIRTGRAGVRRYAPASAQAKRLDYSA